jgi:hypothetical protein
MSVVALKAGQMFIKRKHELTDLLKQLDSVTPEAVDLLAETMRNEKVGLKERLKCADILIDYKIAVSEAINKDELTRQIAEIKATGPKTPLVPATGNTKPTGPRLDMTTIQKV